jgi:hypothetical protein
MTNQYGLLFGFISLLVYIIGFTLVYIIYERHRKNIERIEADKKKTVPYDFSKMKPQKQLKIDRTEYQDVADCIRSDQVPASHIVEYFGDKMFYKWYKKKYLND